jgi:nucleotide-binding universal stress UspA family protein
MESFSRILVDIDATATAHPALERAILLAKKTRGTLTIVDVVTVPPYAHRDWPAGTEERLVRDRRQELAQVAQGIREVQAEAKLLVGRPATVLIEEVLRSHHDLIMRSHARDLASSGSRPFGAVDMELLRKCPCPVLLVRHGQPATKPRIACAVDASAEDPNAQELNAKIVEFGLLMADYLESDSPILLHAWGRLANKPFAVTSQLTNSPRIRRMRDSARLQRLRMSPDRLKVDSVRDTWHSIEARPKMSSPSSSFRKVSMCW